MCLLSFQGNLGSYLSHVTAVYVVSSQISQDLTTLIDDPEAKAKTDHAATVQTMRQEHQTLASEQVPKMTHAFQTSILAQLDVEIAANAEMQKRSDESEKTTQRIGRRPLTCESSWSVFSRSLARRCLSLLFSMSRRVELFSECGYYQKKLNELRDEREKRAGKGKPESASDIEKFDRNQKKLDEVQLTYNDVHTKLMADLNKLWETERVKAIGPLMTQFINAERKFAQAYTEALAQIKD